MTRPRVKTCKVMMSHKQVQFNNLGSPLTKSGNHSLSLWVDLDHCRAVPDIGHGDPEVVTGVGGQAPGLRILINIPQAHQLRAVGHVADGVAVAALVNCPGRIQ